MIYGDDWIIESMSNGKSVLIRNGQRIPISRLILYDDRLTFICKGSKITLYKFNTFSPIGSKK